METIDPPAADSKPERSTRDGPWCWQSRDWLQRIRDACDQDKSVTSTLAIYLAMTELASEHRSPKFIAAFSRIVALSGAADRTVRYAVDRLQQIGALDVVSNGKMIPNTYNLLALDRHSLPRHSLPRQPAKKPPMPTSYKNKEEGNKEGGGKERPGESDRASDRSAQRISPPIFSPVQAGQYRREYEALVRDAEAELKRLKADPASRTQVLSGSVQEMIEYLKANQREGWEERVKELRLKPENYEPGDWTPAAAAAMNGVVGHREVA